jgi:polyisoprenoid-binding protein YceI
MSSINRRSSSRTLTSRWFRAGLLLLSIGMSAGTLQGQEMALELDPANTKINFTLEATLHTVHGTFALKSGTIHFNPSTGSASGLVVVDAASGDTENKNRDQKMHKDILETQRYPEITFTPTKLSGKVDLSGDSSVQVDGVLKLHGADHPLTLTLPVQAKGNHLGARTHVVIPYIAWGLKSPNTFLLRVGDTVDVDVSAVGRVSGRETPSQPVQNH